MLNYAEMKSKLCYGIMAVILFLCSCEDMNEKTEKYYGEIVYPAKYDTIFGKIGYERVEIDLLKAGRIPSEKIKMGKAKKTIIEYDDKKIVMDKLVSWVNITGLTQSKIYRFSIYTMDEYENKSVPQEIALIPFTSSDLEEIVMTAPRIMTSPSSAIVEWPAGLSSILVDYYGLSYEYTDKTGRVVKGERGKNARFFVGNLEVGKSYTVKMKYKIRPKVNNEVILDTLMLSRTLTLNIPTNSGTFSPSERDVLVTNGLGDFSFEAASKLKKLVYPIDANSLQDIFYFSNIEELDLTGSELFKMKTYTYNRNNVKSKIGGGNWQPFIAKVEEINDTQILKDLLEAQTLKKVRYIPNSMGLDDLLAPYVKTGVVELIEMPQEALVSDHYIIDGRVQDNNFSMEYTFNPNDAPAGEGLQNVYKIIPKKKSASFVMALPPEYRFNTRTYKYLKYRVYAPPKSVFTDNNTKFQRIWIRCMNHMWSFAGNSTFGQEYWSPGVKDIVDSELQKWTEYTVDLSKMDTRHNRVIIINIGGEPGVDPSGDFTYYFSNIRFSK